MANYSTDEHSGVHLGESDVVLETLSDTAALGIFNTENFSTDVLSRGYFDESVVDLDTLSATNHWEEAVPDSGNLASIAYQIQLPDTQVQLPDTQSFGFRNSVPTATCALPSVDPHPGEHNFRAAVSLEATGSDCLYSSELNKIFVNVNKIIPVKFMVSHYEEGLYIRALPIYVATDDLQNVVTRCITHITSDKTEGNEVNLVEHFLRCTSPNAIYCKAEDSGRLSVRVPLEAPQPGTDSVTFCYKISCLNSCNNGHSRRKMGIIFTLENEMREVLGRAFMNLRACSCPKRDKEKEENKTKGEKRRIIVVDSNGPLKKVLKIEPGEVAVVKIPVKACHIKELAKSASDLIYRDIGKEQRQLTEQEKRMLSIYENISKTSEGDLLEYQ